MVGLGRAGLPDVPEAEQVGSQVSQGTLDAAGEPLHVQQFAAFHAVLGAEQGKLLPGNLQPGSPQTICNWPGGGVGGRAVHCAPII